MNLRHLLPLFALVATVLGARQFDALAQTSVGNGFASRAALDKTLPPNVLLLIDNSGSMEHMNVDETPPACAGATAAALPNRWKSVLNVVTGAQPNARCLQFDRSGPGFASIYGASSYTTPPLYDLSYSVPHYLWGTPGSLPGRICARVPVSPGVETSAVADLEVDAAGNTYGACSQAVSDSNSFMALLDGKARLGLMMFDVVNDAANTRTGMWSYASTTPPAALHYLGCPDPGLVMEVGARSTSAPLWEGKLVAFPPSTDPANNNYAQLRDVLLSSRPYGGTPIAGMLADAHDYISKNSDACRDNHVILLTDGAPNLDGRPACATGTCPFDPPATIVTSMKTGAAKITTWVVGFSIDGAGTQLPTSATVSVNSCPAWHDATDATTFGNWCSRVKSGQTPDASIASWADPVRDADAAKACCNLYEMASAAAVTGQANDRPYFAANAAGLQSLMAEIALQIAATAESRTAPVVGPADATGARSTFAVGYVPPGKHEVGSGDVARAKGYTCSAPGAAPTPINVAAEKSLGERLGHQARGVGPYTGREMYTVRSGVLGGERNRGDYTMAPATYAYPPVGSDPAYVQTGSLGAELPAPQRYDVSASSSTTCNLVGSAMAHVNSATYDPWSTPGCAVPPPPADDPAGYVGRFLDMHDLDARYGRGNSYDTSLTGFGGLGVCGGPPYYAPGSNVATPVPAMNARECGMAIAVFAMASPRNLRFGGGGSGTTPPFFDHEKWRCPQGTAGPCNAMGPILEASPVVVGPPSEGLSDPSYQAYAAANVSSPTMLYVQEGGILHAFDTIPLKPAMTAAETARHENPELWAFVPPGVQASLAGLYPYMNRPLLDVTPVVRDVPLLIREQEVGANASLAGLSSRWRRVLLSGLGHTSEIPRIAGYSEEPRGYYALDVTSPTVAPKFFWQLTDVASNKIVATHIKPGHGLYMNRSKFSTDSFATATDSDRGSLFGQDSAPPALTTLVYNQMVDASGKRVRDPSVKYGHQIAVAILPGGQENAPYETSAGVRKLCSRANAAVGSANNKAPTGYPVRAHKLCWGINCASRCDDDAPYTAVKGRYVVVVRVDTGEIIRVFGRKRDFTGGKWGPATGDNTVIDTPLDAPMTGAPFMYPQYTGGVATKFFMSDAEGVVWRFDMSSTDPSEWRGDIFFDPYTEQSGATDAATTLAWQNLGVPLEMSTNAANHLVVAMATGEQKKLRDHDSQNYVWSVTEELGSFGWRGVVNHGHKLDLGARAVGRLVVEDSNLYYTLFTPPVSGVCGATDPNTRLCVRHYETPMLNASGVAISKDIKGGNGPFASPIPSLCDTTDLAAANCCNMGAPVLSGITMSPADSCVGPDIDTSAGVLPSSGGSTPSMQISWATAKADSTGKKPVIKVDSANVSISPTSRRTILDSWVAILE